MADLRIGRNEYYNSKAGRMAEEESTLKEKLGGGPVRG